MPLPTITTREDLIRALYEAAELEHGIICQYLFAAFSLKSHIDEGQVTWPQLERIREWKSAILLTARQEMEHLGLVCNLLTSIGGAPHFRHPPFPHATPYCPSYPIFALQPFCAATIQRFVCFEQCHRLAEGDTAPWLAGKNATVGMLYHTIKHGLEVVNTRLHQDKSGVLFVGPREAQITNQHLGLPPGHFDVDVVAIHDLPSAVQAINHILEAGVATVPHNVSHAERFAQILDELEQMQRHDSDFAPARPVACNPVTRPAHAMCADVTVVTQPITLQAAGLFNLAYDTMLLMLTRFYTHVDLTPDEVEGLLKTAFFPLMTVVIRPLGEMLTCMPVHQPPSMATAGPSFALEPELPLHPFRRSAWTLLYERLQAMTSMCAELCSHLAHIHTPWAEKIQPRLVFLHENLQHMANNFERHMHLRRDYVELLLRRLL